MASTSSHLIICYLFVAAISCYPVDKKATNQTEEAKDFQPVPLPTDFGSYDLDGNGYIDLKELAEVSETSHEEAKKPFIDADDDDDDQISPSEFEKAPWSLQGKVEDFKGDEEDDVEDILDEEDGMMMEAGESVIEEDSENEKLNTDDDEEEEKEVETQREEVAVDYDDDDEVKNMENDDENEELLKEEPLEDEVDDDRSVVEDEALQDEEEEAINEDDEGNDEEDNEEMESDIADPRLIEDTLKDTGYGSEEETVENEIY